MTLFLFVATLSGCTPTCDQVCRKVLFDCDLNTERVALLTCTDSCDRQRTLYEDLWVDDPTGLADAFDDHRRCLMRESCDDIAAGVCYESDDPNAPNIFAFDPDKVVEDDPFDPLQP